MAAIAIGIDLCQNPLRVGCKLAQKLLVEQGSNGANLKAGIEDYDEDFDEQTKKSAKGRENIRASRELVHCFEDARSVAKSYFGSPNIKTAVVVIHNLTDSDTRQFMEATGNRASIPILQVIPEHIAVAVAYADKTKPTGSSKIVIVSSTVGECDVHVVSLSPEGKGYVYDVESRESHCREPKHGIHSAAVGMLGPVRLGVKAGPSFTGFIEHEVMGLPKKEKPSLEKVVVFVGKSAELKRIREIIIKGFSEVKEWGEIEDSEQLAAYGAAVVASSGEPVEWESSDDLVSKPGLHWRGYSSLNISTCAHIHPHPNPALNPEINQTYYWRPSLPYS